MPREFYGFFQLHQQNERSPWGIAASDERLTRIEQGLERIEQVVE